MSKPQNIFRYGLEATVFVRNRGAQGYRILARRYSEDRMGNFYEYLLTPIGRNPDDAFWMHESQIATAEWSEHA